MSERLCISISEAAKMLGLSRGYVYLQAKAGKIPTIRFGKRVMIRTADLESMVANMLPKCYLSDGQDG